MEGRSVRLRRFNPGKCPACGRQMTWCGQFRVCGHGHLLDDARPLAPEPEPVRTRTRTGSYVAKGFRNED